MSKIFGGSKQQSFSSGSSSSSSSNQAFPFLSANYKSGAKSFNQANNALGRELKGGFEGYRDNIGADFMELLGLRKTAGGFSGRGAFQSGAAMKGLANYQEGIGKATYSDYLDKLFQQATMGMGAGQLIGGAGGVSSSASRNSGTGSGSSDPGIGGFLGSIIGAAAAGSDERLKKNIVKIGEYEDGLGIYKYDYIDGRGPFIGVMAQEVAELRPEALGPEVDGYLTVNYGHIEDPKEYI